MVLPGIEGQGSKKEVPGYRLAISSENVLDV